MAQASPYLREYRGQEPRWLRARFAVWTMKIPRDLLFFLIRPSWPPGLYKRPALLEHTLSGIRSQILRGTWQHTLRRQCLGVILGAQFSHQEPLPFRKLLFHSRGSLVRPFPLAGDRNKSAIISFYSGKFKEALQPTLICMGCFGSWAYKPGMDKLWLFKISLAGLVH